MKYVSLLKLLLIGCNATRNIQAMETKILGDTAHAISKDEQKLLDLAKRGCLKGLPQIKKLIEAGVYVDVQDKDGNTPLMLAASQKDMVPLVALLLQSREVSPGWSNNEGKQEKTALIRVYLDMLNNKGQTALMLASKAGNDLAVAMLLAAGASPDIQDKEGKTVLMYASIAGNELVVQLLQKKDASISIQDKDGNSALMFGILQGNEKIIKMLMDAGSSFRLDVKNKQGKSARDLALATGCKSIIKLFEGLGRRVEAKQEGEELKEKNEKRELDFIDAAHGGKIPELEKLLAEGVDINAQDHDNCTALQMGIKHKNVVEFLLKNPALDVNKKGLQGKTALMFAIYHDAEEAAVLLLDDKRINVNIADDFTNSPLVQAAKKNNTKLVSLLIKAGALVNAQNKYGYTALSWAVSNGNEEMVKILLGAHAKVLIPINKNGETALEFAQKGKNQRIISPLQKAAETEKT